MKRIFCVFSGSKDSGELMAIDNEYYLKVVRRELSFKLAKHMLVEQVVDFKIEENVDQIDYKASVRVITADEEKTLKECYNALGAYESDPILADIKQRLSKVIWEE